MSKQRLFNELERALARPDIDRLRHLVSIREGWDALDVKDERKPAYLEKFSDALDEWDGVVDRNHYLGDIADPDKAFALVVLAAASSDNTNFLYSVGFSLLEPLLCNASDGMLERVLLEARRTPRFLWMLRRIIVQTIRRTEVRSSIANIVGEERYGIDPLPVRPFA